MTAEKDKPSRGAPTSEARSLSRRLDSGATTLRISHAEIQRLLAEHEAVPTPRTPRTLALADLTPLEGEVAVDDASWAGLEPVSAAALPLPVASVPAKPTAVAMEAHFAEGNFEEAMVVAESLLERDPNHSAARECLERCDIMLVSSYTTELVQVRRVPLPTVAGPEKGSPPFDARQAAVFALVDGQRTIEDILRASGLGKLEGLRTLAELALVHAIDLR